MQRKKAQLAYLKQGERLPGGKAAIYLANNMFRLDVISKLKSTEAFGFDGFVVDVSILKSRTNKSGKSVPMVFNQDAGFDPELSLFMLLKSEGKINGAGVGLYLSNRNDMKFSQKTFKEKLYSNPELQKLFAEECYSVLSTLLSSETLQETAFNTDVSSMIVNMGMLDIPA